MYYIIYSIYINTDTHTNLGVEHVLSDVSPTQFQPLDLCSPHYKDQEIWNPRWLSLLCLAVHLFILPGSHFRIC